MKRLITTALIAFSLLASPAMAQAPGGAPQGHEENRGPGAHNDHRNARQDHRHDRKDHRRDHKERRRDRHHG